MTLKRRMAYFTHDNTAGAYYFGPTERSKPIKTQRHVEAIIDIADDGTLAGVELLIDVPPPPTPKP